MRETPVNQSCWLQCEVEDPNSHSKHLQILEGNSGVSLRQLPSTAAERQTHAGLEAEWKQQRVDFSLISTDWLNSQRLLAKTKTQDACWMNAFPLQQCFLLLRLLTCHIRNADSIFSSDSAGTVRLPVWKQKLKTCSPSRNRLGNAFACHRRAWFLCRSRSGPCFRSPPPTSVAPPPLGSLFQSHPAKNSSCCNELALLGVSWRKTAPDHTHFSLQKKKVGVGL